jgi:hypothetical protein
VRLPIGWQSNRMLVPALAAIGLAVAGCYNPADPKQVAPFVIELLIFIFGMIIVIFAVTLYAMRSFMRRMGVPSLLASMHEESAPIANGVRASAVIESISDTGLTISMPGVGPNAPRYRLGLRVTPADGFTPPYETEVTTLVPRIYAPMIVPGASLGVIVDSANPMNVQVDFSQLSRPAS